MIKSKIDSRLIETLMENTGEMYISKYVIRTHDNKVVFEGVLNDKNVIDPEIVGFATSDIKNVPGQGCAQKLVNISAKEEKILEGINPKYWAYMVKAAPAEIALIRAGYGDIMKVSPMKNSLNDAVYDRRIKVTSENTLSEKTLSKLKERYSGLFEALKGKVADNCKKVKSA